MTKHALAVNYWGLLPLMQIIASIPFLPLKLMKSWLRPAYDRRAPGFVRGVCPADESHSNLTEHADLLFFRSMKNDQSSFIKDRGWKSTRRYYFLTRNLSCI